MKAHGLNALYTEPAQTFSRNPDKYEKLHGELP